MGKSEEEVNDLLKRMVIGMPNMDTTLARSNLRVQARIADNLGRIADVLEKNATFGGKFQVLNSTDPMERNR